MLGPGSMDGAFFAALQPAHCWDEDMTAQVTDPAHGRIVRGGISHRRESVPFQ